MSKIERYANLTAVVLPFAAFAAAVILLWNSVVELMASHESGYLEHCRRYALGDG